MRVSITGMGSNSREHFHEPLPPFYFPAQKPEAFKLAAAANESYRQAQAFCQAPYSTCHYLQLMPSGELVESQAPLFLHYPIVRAHCWRASISILKNPRL